jgi:hypothetical protein
MGFLLDRPKIKITQNNNGNAIINGIIRDWKAKKQNTFHNSEQLYSLIYHGFDDYNMVKQVSDWYLNEDNPYRAFFKVHCNTLSSFVTKFNIVKEACDCVRFENDSNVLQAHQTLCIYYAEPQYKILYLICQSYRQLKLFETHYVNDIWYNPFMRDRIGNIPDILVDWHTDNLNTPLLKEILENWFTQYKIDNNITL